MSLVEFLSARIAADAATAQAALPFWADQADGAVLGDLSVESWTFIHDHDPARVLADCNEKRRIVDLLTYPSGGIRAAFGPEQEAVLRILAEAWADHPDYQQEWRLT